MNPLKLKKKLADHRPDKWSSSGPSEDIYDDGRVEREEKGCDDVGEWPEVVESGHCDECEAKIDVIVKRKLM